MDYFELMSSEVGESVQAHARFMEWFGRQCPGEPEVIAEFVDQAYQTRRAGGEESFACAMEMVERTLTPWFQKYRKETGESEAETLDRLLRVRENYAHIRSTAKLKAIQARKEIV